MMKKYYSFTLLLLGILFLSACKKSGCTDTNAINHDTRARANCCCEYATDNVTMDFDITVNGNSFQLGQTYNINGRNIQINDMKFYISNVHLQRQNGDITVVDSSIAMFNPNNGLSQSLGMIDNFGNYETLKFIIGLDSTINHSDPALYTSGPLAPQSPSMFWSWNPGRRFILIEGKTDTTTAATGVMDADLTYHIGLDALVRTKTITKNVSTTDTKSVHYDMELDMNTLFSNVDLRTEYYTKTMNNMPLAQKIADNMVNAISVK